MKIARPAKLIRTLTALVALSAVSACATPWQVADVQNTIAAPMPSVGSPFTKALFKEYQALAKHEAFEEYEWRHAAIFADKADHAATGEMVLPEVPAEWEVPATVQPELDAARATLMNDFDKGARERVPEDAAKAQASYDCWVEEEWERDSDADCKNTFMATEPKLKAPAPAPVAETPALAQPLVVLFDYNKADITAAAMQALWEAAPALKAAKPAVIHIHGFTDTVGGEGFNKSLSERRAKAVAEQLKKLGVETVQMDVAGFGKTKLAVPTRNNVKEQRNRRVEVTWDAPAKTSDAGPESGTAESASAPDSSTSGDLAQESGSLDQAGPSPTDV